ncbi:hypothetical protein [Apilactobacillus xinyiensis]|uniref:hypothetical protein n=1 Tax=Apilactobacillus xinyiensis TaxID=2841032 RepID=UPI00200EECA0|nr:hypothetical protein [Apilactobacillus xinyiensis]MCL0330642.1 hypothetical protein [Apilactobacillus xinyiensis]
MKVQDKAFNIMISEIHKVDKDAQVSLEFDSNNTTICVNITFLSILKGDFMLSIYEDELVFSGQYNHVNIQVLPIVNDFVKNTKLFEELQND